MIEAQNTFALALCVIFMWQMVKTCVIRLRVIDGPNARDQIGFCAFHSFLVEVILVPRATRLNLTKKRRALGTRMNECWLHTCDACVITTCRLGLRAPVVARNEERWSRSYLHLKFAFPPLTSSSSVIPFTAGLRWTQKLGLLLMYGSS